MGALCCCCDSSSSELPDSEFYKSTDQIKVYLSSKNDIIYEPLKNAKKIGVIIYPGATAKPNGYVHIAYNLAQNGYFTVVCKMPCNSAAFGSNRATDIYETYKSKANKWIIGGHSLGGIFSTKFIYDNYRSKQPNYNFVGLFHLASRGYHKHDISNLNIPTLVLYADLDGLIKKDLIEESFKYLPKNTTTVKLLKGGNHSYFGNFPVGRFCCLSDNEATITRDEQFKFTVNEMLEFLKTF